MIRPPLQPHILLFWFGSIFVLWLGAAALIAADRRHRRTHANDWQEER